MGRCGHMEQSSRGFFTRGPCPKRKRNREQNGFVFDELKENCDNIKILNCNVRSLRSKTNLVDMYVIDKNIDVLCITEHWCKTDEIGTLSISNYVCAGHVSRANSAGGGAAIFVIGDLPCQEIKWVGAVSIKKCIEVCCVMILNVYYLCVYRTPGGPFDNILGDTKENTKSAR